MLNESKGAFIRLEEIYDVIEAAGEDFKVQLISHITDFGLDDDNMIYVNCKIGSHEYFLDIHGIYGEHEDEHK